jgi:hypothetical protein
MVLESVAWAEPKARDLQEKSQIERRIDSFFSLGTPLAILLAYSHRKQN